MTASTQNAQPDHPLAQSINLLALVALGVVFGDIGTSPLYAFQLTLAAANQTATPALAMGIASFIFWSLFIIILLKYVVGVLRADNHGQGGILALVALVTPETWRLGGKLGVLGLLGIMGSSFIIGDGIITPSISVLSAMEGLKVLTPAFAPCVIPVTLVILTGLFAIQKFGTDAIGKLFGPVMLVWFTTIGLLGLYGIGEYPQVLNALNPMCALRLITSSIANLGVAAAMFGAIFLALTGGEALYADLGHVGAPAIRRAFIFLVFPALTLNYLGQAAAVIVHPAIADNPFYKMGPSWTVAPMIFLAAAATIIASQALITGLFSLVHQCIQMNLLPRTKEKHTSDKEIGQIFIPSVNWMLWFGCIACVLIFKTSDALGAAYGIAVSGTMLITTILMYFWLTRCQKVNPDVAMALAIFFGIIDFGFFMGNLMKFVEGGYLPISIGLICTFVMTSWRKFRLIVSQRLNELSMPVPEFMKRLVEKKIQTVPGTAVVVTKVATAISPVWVHHVEENGCMHENLVLLTVEPMPVPIVYKPNRVERVVINERVQRVTLKLGYMQTARIKRAVAQALGEDIACKAHFFVGHEVVERKGTGSQIGYIPWLVVSNLHPLAARITDFFRLKGEHVEEIGYKIEI